MTGPLSFRQTKSALANPGSRSLPQSLGGGDLDGDLYNIIQYEGLFPKETVEPAAYEPTVLEQLPEGQRCTIDHVAEFIVNFINNDRLGIISQLVGIFQAAFLLTASTQPYIVV